MATSLKEYLKRYESNAEEEKKSGKKKKKKTKTKPDAAGVLVVDEDPVWQKPVNIEEENGNDSADEEKPQVDEDIEVKRMKRLELLRARRPYNSISEDGSGWVSLSHEHGNLSIPESNISPPRKSRARNDTPSPEPEPEPLDSNVEDNDLSPRRKKRHHTPSPTLPSSDFSPPRKHRARNDTPSPRKEEEEDDDDLSPPRQKRKRRHAQSPAPDRKKASSVAMDSDFSPPRRPPCHPSNVSERGRSGTQDDIFRESDLSPPRKSKKDVSLPADISPPRRDRKVVGVSTSSKEQWKTGLITGREMKEEIAQTKKEDWLRFKEMDPSISGRGAEPVYRDRIKGERITKEEFLKSQKKVEEKPKEIKLEWGRGLAQKREAEARLQELELEKDKPFARTRDDPDLDRHFKEKIRWGDPMAHLVKKKNPELLLPNLGDNEKMQESGFVVPQDIPSHSWLKRGLDAAPNRYGIRPGRHWDGVDRSTGYEKQLFKRTNEKQATEREAYLWSVSDM